MGKMVILVRNGTYESFTTASMLASGAAAVDIDIFIFAMESAVLYLSNDEYKNPPKFHADIGNYKQKMMEAANNGVITPWYELISDLKEFTEMNIVVCSMAADALGLKKENFPDFVDSIAGVATYAAEAEGADIFITL